MAYQAHFSPFLKGTKATGEKKRPQLIRYQAANCPSIEVNEKKLAIPVNTADNATIKAKAEAIFRILLIFGHLLSFRVTASIENQFGVN